MPFSDLEKQKEAERAIAQRERAYPGLVAQKKMRRIDAERQTAIMREIASDYQAKAGTKPATAPSVQSVFGESK